MEFLGAEIKYAYHLRIDELFWQTEFIRCIMKFKYVHFFDYFDMFYLQWQRSNKEAFHHFPIDK